MNSAIGECKSPYYIMKWAIAFFAPWFLQGKLVVGNALAGVLGHLAFSSPGFCKGKLVVGNALARVLGHPVVVPWFLQRIMVVGAFSLGFWAISGRSSAIGEL